MGVLDFRYSIGYSAVPNAVPSAIPSAIPNCLQVFFLETQNTTVPELPGHMEDLVLMLACGFSGSGTEAAATDWQRH